MTKEEDIIEIERPRILAKIAACMQKEPVTITAFPCDRSQGSVHDYYSEADYWWPDPNDPGAPLMRRDGMSNPDNFNAHRHAMMDFRENAATLCCAFLITKDDQYACRARRHLVAWFVSPKTRMKPNLRFSQAIRGRCSGRSFGLIDTIHLVEVARTVCILDAHGAIPPREYAGIRRWFFRYLDWLTTHRFGRRERSEENNHGISWSLQAAAFAQVVGDNQLLKDIRHTFKGVYLSQHMDDAGRFPEELKRTKPYGYSLFVTDIMACLAQILSDPKDNLWTCALKDGRGMGKALDFIYPYISDKSTWPYGRDAMYWDEWPVRQASILLGGLNLHNDAYLDTWANLEADPVSPEVLRNLPLRYPLLWVGEDAFDHQSRTPANPWVLQIRRSTKRIQYALQERIRRAR